MDLLNYIKKKEETFDLNNFPELRELVNYTSDINNLIQEYKLEVGW